MVERKILKIIRDARAERARQRELPRLTFTEMKSWADPLGREVVREADPFAVDGVAEREPERVFDKKSVYVIVRYKDSKAWAGPWISNGKLFTSVESKMYKFPTKNLALDAVDREKFDFRVDVFEI